MRTKGLPPNRVVEILNELNPIIDKYDPLNLAAALTIVLVNVGPLDKAGFLRSMETGYDTQRFIDE
jgi:hypothetical protein